MKKIRVWVRARLNQAVPTKKCHKLASYFESCLLCGKSEYLRSIWY